MIERFKHDSYATLITNSTPNMICQVMQKFRECYYNTLVSTCVGEEGLDIGNVSRFVIIYIILTILLLSSIY